MRYGNVLSVFVAMLAFAIATPVRAGTQETLDAYIAQQMEEGAIAGVGAAILVDGKVAWTKGYGHADIARGVPFTPDTMMNIGSISKTVTGVAMMRLVQEGKLSLDEDVDAHLPFKVRNPRFPDEKITLRQIATHTSGIADRWDVYKRAYHYGGDAPEALGTFLESYFVPGGANWSADNFVDAKPGTHREYSNIGAGLAGYIVERVSGEKLDAYTKRIVFEPLGMQHTGWFLADIDRARHSTLYVSQGGMTIPIPLYGLSTYPDGGVRTSVADLSRFFAMLLNGGAYEGVRVLDQKTVDEMLRFHYTKANKPDNVDLAEKNVGLFWQSKYNVTRVGHGGSDPGVMTDMLASLDGKIGVVVFSNTSLSGEDTKYYANIFKAVWEEAGRMRAERGAKAGDSR
ncbi:beta-lactamase family protein [Lysobacter sp. A6]|uniref:Beta-lactamase family protein n=1 Tax=Noviluteimonas lactosilytica TaxID=2888523 RepID=A0ABS8JKX1_9GAMM|nr:serine hydrolase domain-containing protein [Lysobacter lactosilyticus]MCC8364261.1 beta-lactamase family protein [Lysobacter lactosilyticus]